MVTRVIACAMLLASTPALFASNSFVVHAPSLGFATMREPVPVVSFIDRTQDPAALVQQYETVTIDEEHRAAFVPTPALDLALGLRSDARSPQPERPRSKVVGAPRLVYAMPDRGSLFTIAPAPTATARIAAMR